MSLYANACQCMSVYVDACIGCIGLKGFWVWGLTIARAAAFAGDPRLGKGLVV